MITQVLGQQYDVELLILEGLIQYFNNHLGHNEVDLHAPGLIFKALRLYQK